MNHDASRALMERAQQSIPGGISSYARQVDLPISFASGAGSRVTDVDGTEYVDYLTAWGAITLGHSDPDVNAAVSDVLAEQDLYGMGTTELEVEVAELVTDRVPCAERLLFGVTGTEVVSSAIRLARGVTERPKVVKFQGHYHGSHDSLVLNHATPAEDLGAKDPFTKGVLDSVLEETIVLPFNDPEAVENTFAAHGDEIAAVILEPIAHNMGCVLPEAGFLETLRAVTAEHGSLLIFDEIVSGFRHDPGGAQAIFDVTPDLATFGKSVANGYPLSMLCGAAEYMERFQTTAEGDVAYGGTYNAHAGSLAAARETIQRLEDEDFYRRGAEMSKELATAIGDVITDTGLDAQVRQFGTVFLTYFTTDPIRRWEDVLSHDSDRYREYRRGMIDHGILMVPKDARRNYLTASHTQEDVQATIDAAAAVLPGVAD